MILFNIPIININSIIEWFKYALRIASGATAKVQKLILLTPIILISIIDIIDSKTEGKLINSMKYALMMTWSTAPSKIW